MIALIKSPYALAITALIVISLALGGWYMFERQQEMKRAEANRTNMEASLEVGGELDNELTDLEMAVSDVSGDAEPKKLNSVGTDPKSIEADLDATVVLPDELKLE